MQTVLGCWSTLAAEVELGEVVHSSFAKNLLNPGYGLLGDLSKAFNNSIPCVNHVVVVLVLGGERHQLSESGWAFLGSLCDDLFCTQGLMT